MVIFQKEKFDFRYKGQLSHLILSCPFFVRRPLYLGLSPSLSSLFLHPTAVGKKLGLGAAQAVPTYSAPQSGVG